MNDIFAKLRLEGECWIFTGSLNRGYGRANIAGRTHYVHRWVWEHFNGPIPDGLSLDHLCRRTACANPAHLDAVPHRVNVLRGDGPTAKNAAKTHCPYGHELRRQGLRRQCQECQNERGRRERRTAQANPGQIQCPDCGRGFDNPRGLWVHAGRIHAPSAAAPQSEASCPDTCTMPDGHRHVRLTIPADSSAATSLSNQQGKCPT